MRIDLVLDCLSKAGLTANPKKCAWGQTELEYLGHVVGSGQVKPMEAKVRAIENYVKPVTKKNVWEFFRFGWLLPKIYTAICCSYISFD